MRRMIASALMLSLFSFSVVGLSGCAEESKVTETKKVDTPGGTKEVTSETKVKATGDEKTNP